MRVGLSGPIDAELVEAVCTELELGFAYYKYKEIKLGLNSPGGEYHAMQTLMTQIRHYAHDNHQVHVQAGQMCASAAAFLLANANWGTRRVQVDTQLLFHWTRANMAPGLAMTGDLAAGLARNLNALDQMLITQLVESLCAGAGGESALIYTIESRLFGVQQAWDQVESVMQRNAMAPASKDRAWVMALQRNLRRWRSASENRKKLSGLTHYLKLRFEKDSMMDLREAYALCLIDEIGGVWPMSGSRVDHAAIVYDRDDVREQSIERIEAKYYS